ncbi:MAG: D-alanine-D-alanine ligase [Parcubacteria group bacterium GW2011_GWC2_39_14]|nr:MAG: D-alanine-D-alanine ligase [Parcubacteria group bacterium GW2011_GWC2_39_14]KKR55193.1 MAG: D-alanine-D-alanine ligase [Parcubacteria group bacterium GW2011_GWA2_40_23]
MGKLRVGIFFGGRSTEHEISLLSAFNIIKALDRKKYQIIPIGIDKQGNFLAYKLTDKWIVNVDDPKKISLGKSGVLVSFAFGQSKELIELNSNRRIKVDLAFPVLHGAYGEDGTIQGLFKMADIPFIGCGVLGSAVGMDKDVAKRLLRDAGLLIADFVSFDSSNKNNIKFANLKKALGLPFFLKPANAGSSVGVYKIVDELRFSQKVNDAFKYDNKIIFEKTIIGKEIECSVIGSDDPLASLPGAVIPKDQFYSYKAKYLDEDGAQFEIPAKLSSKLKQKIRAISIQVYKVLGCEGLARVDGFLTKDEKFVINEINTLPGFTAISMYPKLWEVSGVSYKKLLDQLILLALQRSKKGDKLQSSFRPK